MPLARWYVIDFAHGRLANPMCDTGRNFVPPVSGSVTGVLPTMHRIDPGQRRVRPLSPGAIQHNEIVPVNDLIAPAPTQDRFDPVGAMARDSCGIL